MTHYRFSLSPLSPSQATPRQAELLDRGRAAAQGMLPNMYRAMAHSPALLDAYLAGYNALRNEGHFSAAELEVVFLVLSYENGCDYCVAAHSLLADTSSRVARDVTDAIRAGQPIGDAKLAALAAMTRAMLLSRGRPETEAVQAFLAAGYGEPHMLDIVAAIGVKTMSNYTNHLFDTPLDALFKVREFTVFKAAQRLVEYFAPRTSAS